MLEKQTNDPRELLCLCGFMTEEFRGDKAERRRWKGSGLERQYQLIFIKSTVGNGGGALSWLSSPCTTASLHGMLRVQTSQCAGNMKSSWESELVWQLLFMIWLITVGDFGWESRLSFDSSLSIPHIIVPVSSLSFLRTLTSFAPLNTATMRWPGADAVDLHTGSCEWAASICRSDLMLLCAAVSLHCFSEASRFGQWTAVQLPEWAFLAAFRADAKKPWGSTFLEGSAVSRLFTFLWCSIGVHHNPACADGDAIWQKPQGSVSPEGFAADLYIEIIQMNRNDFVIFSRSEKGRFIYFFWNKHWQSFQISLPLLHDRLRPEAKPKGNTVQYLQANLLHSPLRCVSFLQKHHWQNPRKSGPAQSSVWLNVPAGMLGILRACVSCVVNAEAWPRLAIGSLFTCWVIGLRGYRQKEREGWRCTLSENGEGQKTRDEQWPRWVILKNVRTLTECQAETGEWRDKNLARENQAVTLRTEKKKIALRVWKLEDV